ncbi:hypothetical protein PAGU2595_018670 [Lysobacter xanthus]
MTTFTTPAGQFDVRLFDGRVGDWRAPRRVSFQQVLLERWGALADLFKALLGGDPTDLRMFSDHVSAFLGEQYDVRRTNTVVARVEARLVVLGIRTDPEKDARRHADAIRTWVQMNGLPKAVVDLTHGRPRVDVPALVQHAGEYDAHLGAVLAPLLQETLDEVAARSPWSESAKRFVPTTHRPHGRETFPGVLFDFHRFGVERGGLLDAVIDQILLPGDHLTTGALRNWILWLTCENRDDSQRAQAVQILSKVSGHTPAEARVLSELLAGVTALRAMTDKTRYGYITSFRHLLTRTYLAIGAEVPHFPRGAMKALVSNTRGMLSDAPDPGAINPEFRPTIVNVAQGPPQRARQSAIGHVEDRLLRVKAACDQDIEGFLKWRAWTEAAEALPLDEQALGYVDRLIAHGAREDSCLQRWLVMADLQTIVAVALVAMKKNGYHTREGHGVRVATNRSINLGLAAERLQMAFPDLERWSSKRSGQGRFSTFRNLLSHWYVPRWVQFAIELRIQADTAFNRHTVRNLTASGISISNATIELQALKGKTEELQTAEIDGSDRTLRAALELMRGHGKNVVEHWQADEKRVFVALVSSNDTVSFGLWPCHHIHERFIDFHKLFKFTREQLRNQNAGLVYLKSEDVHEVQGRLGHASIKTTSGYVRQHIIAVLNRANIAEFVRRLGASIVWVVEGPEAVGRRGMLETDVSERLLFPLGVQKQVAAAPECDAWIADPEWKLQINELRIRHLVAQRAYYARNWQKLRASSPEAYEKVHRPRIEFVAALWEIVADSEFAQLLQEPA